MWLWYIFCLTWFEAFNWGDRWSLLVCWNCCKVRLQNLEFCFFFYLFYKNPFSRSTCSRFIWMTSLNDYEVISDQRTLTWKLHNTYLFIYSGSLFRSLTYKSNFFSPQKKWHFSFFFTFLYVKVVWWFPAVYLFVFNLTQVKTNEVIVFLQQFHRRT